jgi:hypothetical protein
MFKLQTETQLNFYNTPPPGGSQTPKPSFYYDLCSSSEEDAAPSTARIPFTEEDRLSFIRYAAARPTGMAPVPGEAAVDVWNAFAKQVGVTVCLRAFLLMRLGY